MASSDETYCSEVDKANKIRRSSRINTGKIKCWGTRQNENKYKNNWKIEENEKNYKKKSTKVLVKNISKEDYVQIDWKKSKIVLQKKNHYDEEPNKSKKRGHPKKIDQEKHARENLIQWSKQMHQHISGRLVIDYQKAIHILSELKKIKNVCTTNSSNMQVWEKLEHQLSYIADEHLSSATTDNMNVLYTNQVAVQQSDEWDRGQLPLQAINLGEGLQSILDEQSTGYQNNKICYQTPLMLYENLSSVAIDNMNVKNTDQVNVQQSEGRDRGQFPLQTTNSTEESQSILNEQCPNYYNNNFCSQKPSVAHENLSSVATDSKNDQSSNQVMVQQSEEWDRGQLMNTAEGSQSILNEQCPSYYNNFNYSQKPLIQDFENLIQKTEISRNMQCVNHHYTTNFNNLAESETQCEFISLNIPNCDPIRQSMENMNVTYSLDVIPDSQNISMITRPTILKKVTKGSKKHSLKSLSDKIAKLKISKPKKMKKIEEGPKPQLFSVKDSENSSLNHNSLKNLTENGSIDVNPKSEGSCANNTLQGPIYSIVQNNMPATKPVNACKKKVQFSAPSVTSSKNINSLLISSQTENKTQDPWSEIQTQQVRTVNQTQEFRSVNQTQEFGSENHTQEFSSVNLTDEFGSEIRTQELGSVSPTQEFGSENQMQELGLVNQTQGIDSVSRPHKENFTTNSTPTTSKVLPASVNSSFGWIKSIQRVYKADPTEFTSLSMLPKSFLDDPLSHLPTEWEGDFDIW